MKLSKSFKYRLKLKPKHRRIFAQWAGCSRFVYNRFLEQRNTTYEKEKKSLSYVDQANQLPGLKKEFSWLGEPPSQSLQQTLKDLDQAFKNFFRRIKTGDVPGYPNFKKKGMGDSFRLPDPKQFFVYGERRKGIIKLPKIGEVKFIKSRAIEGKIRNATISKECDQWYISFNCEVEQDIPCNTGGAIGIDRGVTHTFATSNNETKDIPTKTIKKLERKITKEQRKLSRKKKFSANWIKQKKKIGKVHHKISNIRKDFLHKESTNIAKNHSYIVLEDLKTKNMTKSAKGTVEEPGKNVAAKAGLNRAILRNGWHMFQTFLEYKAKWYGAEIRYVDPKYTSQKCSNCGYIEKENRKSQATFECLCCGYKDNADINAAKNILATGLVVNACGDVA